MNATGDGMIISPLPVKDKNGEVSQVVVITRDITERKRMEDALRESEERYRSVIDELPDYVIVHQKGELLFVNNSISMVMGSSIKDLLHSNILTYVAPESREIVLKAIENGSMVDPCHLMRSGYSYQMVRRGGLRYGARPLCSKGNRPTSMS